MSDLAEPFARERDSEHPVRWSPADGDTPAYLTLKGAVERLTRDGGDPVAVREGLQAGRQFRTMFAFYQLDEHPAEPVADALGVMTCRICAKPTRQWPDGSHAIHAQA